jgi:NAD-dependent deacetylase
LQVIDPVDGAAGMAEVAFICSGAEKVVALSGAGISVASGISDFRSPGGLWSIFNPDEYATLSVFRQDPEKAWQLYRALGRELSGKRPNGAHQALAELEARGTLSGIVTQNVDNLHQQAGSRMVLEIHGDHQHLQCIRCDHLEPVTDEHYRMEAVPSCTSCGFPLKPNVVLFGESVRHLGEIERLMAGCDLLLVIGTSAQVYPAAGLPLSVKRNGGTILEFNHVHSLGTGYPGGSEGITDYFIKGDVAVTLPLLMAEIGPL